MITIANREVAFVALFATLQGISAFKVCTRRLKHWQDVLPEDQPALYMQHDGEVRQPVRGLPDRIVLEVNLWIYLNTNAEPVGPQLSPLLDAVDAALAPANNGDRTQTLGGIVHHVWIEGQTQIYEGNLGNEAVAIVPIKLLVT